MKRWQFCKYFDAPGGAPAGGGPAGGGAPAPSGGPAPAPAGGSPSGGPPAAAPPAGAPQRFEYAEDRSAWIPPHRLEESRRAATEAATTAGNARYQELEGRYRDLDRRTRAFFEVPDTPNPEHTRLRDSFGEIFPELKPFFSGDGAKLLGGILEMARNGQLQELVSTGNSYWGRHATQVARDAGAAWAKEVGVDLKDLPKNTIQRMAGSLQAFIREDNTNQRAARYEGGDHESLIQEWLEDMRALYVLPMRKVQATNAAQRVDRNRRLPAPGPGGAPPPAGGEPKPKLRGAELTKAARAYAAGE